MNSSYFNMIAGAFLGTFLVILTIIFTSETLFHSENPDKEGFAIEVAQKSATPKASEGKNVIPLIGPLLANADIDAGRKVFKKCAACHTLEKGGANKVGPGLWNFINQAVAAREKFSYSSAMTQYAAGGTIWEYENLNEFLLKPKAYIKGTAMSFAGLKKEKDRANLIAYLRTYSDNPAPLPDE